MKRATILTGLATVIVMASASGCYTTSEVPTTKIASIRRPLSGPRALGGDARLGPRTEVRARLTDGSVTPWLPSADLAVGKDGLVTGRRYPLAAATEVALADAGPGTSEMLAAVAPPGSEIISQAGWLQLRVREPRLLLPWVAAYAGGMATLHGRPGPCAVRTSPRRWSAPIPCARLAEVPPAALARLQIAEGIAWRRVAGLEVHNLDPAQTTAAVLATPVVMSLMMLSIVGATVAAADGRDPGPSLDLGIRVAEATADVASHADDGADTGGAPIHWPNGRAAVLVTESRASEGIPDPATELATTPLFTESARRRDDFKLVLAGEAGLSNEAGFTGSLGAGFRLADFVEITGHARLLFFDETAALSPGESAIASASSVGTGTPHLLFGGRLAFHIDGDGDPRTAFVLGGETLAGSLEHAGTLWQLGAVMGPRFGIGDKLFASLLFTPSLLVADTPDGASAIGQVLFTAELGFDL